MTLDDSYAFNSISTYEHANDLNFVVNELKDPTSNMSWTSMQNNVFCNGFNLDENFAAFYRTLAVLKRGDFTKSINTRAYSSTNNAGKSSVKSKAMVNKNEFLSSSVESREIVVEFLLHVSRIDEENPNNRFTYMNMLDPNRIYLRMFIDRLSNFLLMQNEAEWVFTDQALDNCYQDKPYYTGTVISVEFDEERGYNLKGSFTIALTDPYKRQRKVIRERGDVRFNVDENFFLLPEIKEYRFFPKTGQVIFGKINIHTHHERSISINFDDFLKDNPNLRDGIESENDSNRILMTKDKLIYKNINLFPYLNLNSDYEEMFYIEDGDIVEGPDTRKEIYILEDVLSL